MKAYSGYGYFRSNQQVFVYDMISTKISKRTSGKNSRTVSKDFNLTSMSETSLLFYFNPC